MKMIKLRYLTKAKRSMVMDVHGFEGPAKKPMKGYLFDSQQPLKRGEITSAYTVSVPTSGEFEIVDTQYNRDKLRISTKPITKKDVVRRYNMETGKYYDTREDVTSPPAFQVMDGTDIFEDLCLVKDNGREYTEEEVEKKISDALAQAGTVPKKRGPKIKKKIAKLSSRTKAGTIIDLPEDEPVETNRFAHKV